MIGRLSTLYHRFSKHILVKGFGISWDENEWKTDVRDIQYKKYLRLENFKLPPPGELKGELREALEKRHSAESYENNRPLSLADLSTLLHYAAGQKRKEGSRRFYPSGGARYPLELYIATRANDALPEGLYHYRVTDHSLEKLGGAARFAQMIESLTYPFSKKAPTHLIFTAIWERNFSRYRDFGYPLVLLEAGHLGQNVQLLAANLGLNARPFAGFYLEDLASVLDIEPTIEAPLHTIALGKP